MGKNMKVIQGGTLIDGTGKAPLKDFLLIIEGNKIKFIGKRKDVSIPRDAEAINAEGKTVMPGLIDAHYHFSGCRTHSLNESILSSDRIGTIRSVVLARILLENGFTGIRDCGGLNALALKQAIEEGTILGPKIVAAGSYISQTGGHGDSHWLPIELVRQTRRIADGPSECLRAVRESIREGSDFIKIMTSGGTASMKDPPEISQFNLEEIKEMVNESHAWGRRVATHCYCPDGAKKAMRAGVDTIEHGSLLGTDDETIQMMAEKNIVLVPTLSIIKLEADQGEELEMPEWTYTRSRDLIKYQYDTVKKAHKAGVKIALGTDYMGLYSPPYPRTGSNAYELQLLVDETGFTPMEAIVAGTLRGAEAMGLEKQIGTLEPGKFADILIIDGDPLKNIKILQDVEKILTVIKNGEIAINRTS
jgi:imidazolonepropionase-like amidohydrolase